jgi:hypothetical protein
LHLQVASRCNAIAARIPESSMAWIILVAGVTARGLIVLITKPYVNLDRFEMERAAISLAETGVLGNPYAIPTGPTAHVAPLYAGLLAIIFSLFGTGVDGEIVKVCLSTVLSVVPYSLMPRLAESLGVNPTHRLDSGVVCLGPCCLSNPVWICLAIGRHRW